MHCSLRWPAISSLAAPIREPRPYSQLHDQLRLPSEVAPLAAPTHTIFHTHGDSYLSLRHHPSARPSIDLPSGPASALLMALRVNTRVGKQGSRPLSSTCRKDRKMGEFCAEQSPSPGASRFRSSRRYDNLPFPSRTRPTQPGRAVFPVFLGGGNF